MTVNVGTIDRILRGVLGFILLAAPFVSGWAFFHSPWATALSVILGLVMLGVAATRVCPIYSVLGLRTC
jgi:hypothetical protein